MRGDLEAREVSSAAKGEFESVGDRVGSAQCLQSMSDIHRLQDEHKVAWMMLLAAKASLTRLAIALVLPKEPRYHSQGPS